MRENIGAILLFTAMLGTILLLSINMTGCTRLQTVDYNNRKMTVKTTANDTECSEFVELDYGEGGDSDEFEISKPN